LGTRLKYTPVTPGMACKTVFISVCLPSHPEPLSVRGSRSLIGGVAKAGREMETLTIRNAAGMARGDLKCCIRWTLFCDVHKAALAPMATCISYTMLHSLVEVSGDRRDLTNRTPLVWTHCENPAIMSTL
jgi:hypothetical protein